MEQVTHTTSNGNLLLRNSLERHVNLNGQTIRILPRYRLSYEDKLEVSSCSDEDYSLDTEKLLSDEGASPMRESIVEIPTEDSLIAVPSLGEPVTETKVECENEDTQCYAKDSKTDGQQERKRKEKDCKGYFAKWKKAKKTKPDDSEEVTIQFLNETKSHLLDLELKKEKTFDSKESQLQQPVEQDVIRTRAQQCGDCCRSFIAFFFSTVGSCCIMIGYTIVGGFIFQQLEAPHEAELKNDIRIMRKWHVERLWNLTIGVIFFHPENWSSQAERIIEDYTYEVHQATKKKGWDGQDDKLELQWSYAGALLYSITVVTTIGYGHIAPKTDMGKFVTILYAIIGIPLTLFTISNLGSIMAHAFRVLYAYVCCGLCCICCRRNTGHRRRRRGSRRSSRRNTDELSLCHGRADIPPWRRRILEVLHDERRKKISVPIYISLLLIITYILLGAVLFTLCEKEWNFFIGSYFCFITLTTIGFGDYVPGTDTESWASQEKLVLCALYLVFGLSLIAMCFNLMQEETRKKFRYLGKKIGLVK